MKKALMNTAYRITFAAVSLVLGSNVVGCGSTGDAAQAETEAVRHEDDDDGDPGEALPPVAEVALSDGRSLAFISPAPGIVAIKEIGPDGSERLTDSESVRGMNAAQLYTHVSGRPAPEALLAAMTAEDHSSGAPPAATNETVVPAKGPASLPGLSIQDGTKNSGTLDHTTFVNTFCTKRSGFEQFHWVNVTGRGSVTRSDIMNFSAAATSIQGTIRFVSKARPWYTWKNLANDLITPGWYVRVTFAQGQLDYDARATTEEADGDVYSMCTEFG